MSYDAKNQQTITNLITSASYATNNAATTGFDLKGYDEAGMVLVNIGVKTVGDNDGTITVKLQESATNSAAAAADVSATNVATTNNTANHGSFQVDPRARLRYIFLRRVFAGTNSPEYPISASFIGQKKKVS